MGAIKDAVATAHRLFLPDQLSRDSIDLIRLRPVPASTLFLLQPVRSTATFFHPSPFQPAHQLFTNFPDETTTITCEAQNNPIYPSNSISSHSTLGTILLLLDAFQASSAT